jgi:Uma2 family endonuclease
MATVPRSIVPVAEREEETIPPLEPGDHLDQRTFHERYEAMPDNTRAELIGGVVFMPSPAKPRHGQKHGKVVWWLGCYEMHTPGVEAHDNTSAILGSDSEPQPDAGLLVAPEKGGQTRVNEDGWLEGAPELIAEIAVSTESYDLYEKKRDYERAGVKEYIVVALRQRKASCVKVSLKSSPPVQMGFCGRKPSRVYGWIRMPYCETIANEC